MEQQRTPTPEDIANALRSGAGLEGVDELFYPGDRNALRLRRSKYPRPEGTGRKKSQTTIEHGFRRPDEWIGDRSMHHFYMDGTWIGSITEVREGFCNIHYRTHDGETFAHSGGPTGAERYLEERYWYYGDPPVQESVMNSAERAPLAIWIASTVLFIFIAAYFLLGI